MKPVHLGGAWAALDMVVTFPDGRLGLNPKLETALEHWPGMGARGKTPEGGTIARHAVLSLGLGVYHYDPGIEFADRDADRVLFRGDVDFLLPRHPELPADPALTLLPVDLVQDMYEAVLAPMRQALRLIVASNPQRTWVMAAPPPTGDPAILQRLIRNRAKRHGLDPDAIKALAAGPAEGLASTARNRYPDMRRNRMRFYRLRRLCRRGRRVPQARIRERRNPRQRRLSGTDDGGDA